MSRFIEALKRLRNHRGPDHHIRAHVAETKADSVQHQINNLHQRVATMEARQGYLAGGLVIAVIVNKALHIWL